MNKVNNFISKKHRYFPMFFVFFIIALLVFVPFKHANLIQLNYHVCDLLFERLQLQNEFDFFDLLGLDLLVITKGKKGATFIFKENDTFQSIDQSPEMVAKVHDSSGAGDAFFATVIKEYAYCSKIDISFVTNTFKIANKASRDVISALGSRRI